MTTVRLKSNLKLKGGKTMPNIPEAIEILTDEAAYLDKVIQPDSAAAIRLGIEALKRVKGNRLYPQPTVFPLLPGETK